MADRLIELEISSLVATNGTVFTYNLSFDGRLVATNKALTPAQSEQALDIAETYDGVFANPQQPSSAQLAPAQVRAIGTALYEIWLKPHWKDLATEPGDRCVLVVASSVSNVLNLPWELLRPPDREEIGTDAGWGVRRLPWSGRKLAKGSNLAAAPLRVLFVACSPKSLPELDYEREEEVLSLAVGPKVLMETASLGTFAELCDRTDDFKPHIVHLSGHGTIGPAGAAFFFENENGDRDPRPAEILGQLFSGSGVRCAFVSGCDAGSAPPRNALGGVCQAIVANGVPLAIGFGASIVDQIATKIAEGFYKAVANGRPVDYALARARWFAKNDVGAGGDPSWSLPVLYASTLDTRIIDESLPTAGKFRPSKELRPLPGMPRGYARYLVGRRRDLQTVLPGLRDGTLQGIVVTGMGGSGKSSLATRLARKLEAGDPSRSLKPIAVSCEPNAPLRPEDLLEVCGDAFRLSGNPEASNRAKDTQTSLEERLRLLVDDLSDGYVLVIDNFENSLDEATRLIKDHEIATFYVNVMDNLVGSSRVIVTSRYLPANVDPLPNTIAELALGELSETAYLKFMLRETAVKQRYQAGTPARELLLHLKQRLGAAPGLVTQFRQALKSVDPAQLQDDVDRCIGIAGLTPAGPLLALDEQHEAYCAKIYVDRLYGRLSEASRRMIGRLSVYAGPFRAVDAAAISGASESELSSALSAIRQSALIHGDWTSTDPLWSIYGTLRRWLAASSRLSVQDRQSAHRAAAEYLVKLYEQQPRGGLQSANHSWLLEARAQYIEAGAETEAREVTSRLSKILLQRGEYAEIERLNLELIARAQLLRVGTLEQHPDPATWIARINLERDDYDSARDWYEKALTFAAGAYPAERAHAIQGLATIDLRKGNYLAARARFADALSIQESIDDPQGEAATWHQLGSMDFNDADEAKAAGNEALAMEKYNEARSRFEGALKLLQGVTVRDELVAEQEQAVWHQLGSIELGLNDLDKARTSLEKARRLACDLENRKAEAAAIHQLGRVDARADRTTDALRKLASALEIRRAIGDRAGEAISFRRLGDLAHQLNKPDLALRLTVVCYVIDKALEGEGTRALVRFFSSGRENPSEQTSVSTSPGSA